MRPLRPISHDIYVEPRERKFRPSDWAWRLSGTASVYGDPNLGDPVSVPHVKDCFIYGFKAETVDIAPGMFHSLARFAHMNDLRLTVDPRLKFEAPDLYGRVQHALDEEHMTAEARPECDEG
jgi:hypothetical protein